MLEAKDIMTKRVVCVKKDTPIFEAVELMAESNITAIPVVEDDMTLVGIISKQDALRLLHTYEDERDRTVSDFMTQPVIHFEENEPILDVSYCLRDHWVRSVPVTSEGKVVGIISRSDILKRILRLSETNAVPAGSDSE